MEKSDIPILRAKDVLIDRGELTILKVSELNINGGEALSIIGPNGAGKSTLLKVLSHLFKNFSGRLFFKGLEVGKDISPFEYRRKISMVFQEPLLFNTTVFENVATGLRFRRFNREEIRKIVYEHLERFGIAHLSMRSARSLSGGEAQRVSLARAFAVYPEIIFLDEPFSSLDKPTRDALIEDLERNIKDLKTTAIFATHDRDETLRLSHRVIVMDKGEIVQDGTPEEVMHYPCNEFVASFAGVETILSGIVEKNEGGVVTVSVADAHIHAIGDIAPNRKAIVCIKPEDIILYPVSERPQSSARNTFTGTITRIVPSGFYQKVYLNCGFPLVAYVTNNSAMTLGLSEGMEIKASFKATSVHVIGQ
ncbi:MAG TPA: ABC transporter ATP-binding protein [Syntrophorhabdaceae bacterium]|nr:ABC transporter ATP-binding protein [Syntrophorhabdaceae bacterium]